jgi:hypothetical protein
MHITLFLARDANKNANVQEVTTDGYKFASFVVRLQSETETKGIQGRLCSKCQQSIAKNSQRDLRIGALKYGTREAEQDVAPSIVFRETTCGIEEISRTLE